MVRGYGVFERRYNVLCRQTAQIQFFFLSQIVGSEFRLFQLLEQYAI